MSVLSSANIQKYLADTQDSYIKTKNGATEKIDSDFKVEIDVEDLPFDENNTFEYSGITYTRIPFEKPKEDDRGGGASEKSSHQKRSQTKWEKTQKTHIQKIASSSLMFGLISRSPFGSRTLKNYITW